MDPGFFRISSESQNAPESNTGLLRRRPYLNLRDPQKHISISILRGYPYLNGLHYKTVYMGYPYPNFSLCVFLGPYNPPCMEPYGILLSRFLRSPCSRK